MSYNYRIELLCSSMLPSARLGLPWPLHLNILGQQLRTVLVYPITKLFHGVSTFKSIKHRKPNFLVKHHRVVPILSDQVAKDVDENSEVRDARTWFDFGLGFCGLSR